MKFLGKLFTVVGVAMLGVVGALAQTEDTVANAVIDLSRQSEQLQLAVSELNSTTLPSQGQVSYSMTWAVHRPRRVDNQITLDQNVVTDLHNLSASIAMYTQTINGSVSTLQFWFFGRRLRSFEGRCVPRLCCPGNYRSPDRLRGCTAVR